MEIKKKFENSFIDLRNDVENLINLKEEVIKFEEHLVLSEEEKKDLKLRKEYVDLKIASTDFKSEQEINERLQSLVYNLGKLRVTLLTKDYKESEKLLKNIKENEYYGMDKINPRIIIFKDKIEYMGEIYLNLVEHLNLGELEREINHKVKIDQFKQRIKALSEEQKCVLDKSGKLLVEYLDRMVKDQEADKEIKSSIISS